MTQIALDEISQPLFAVSPHTACGFQQISLIAYPYGSGAGLVMATSLPLHFYSYTIPQKSTLVKHTVRFPLFIVERLQRLLKCHARFRHYFLRPFNRIITHRLHLFVQSLYFFELRFAFFGSHREMIRRCQQASCARTPLPARRPRCSSRCRSKCSDPFSPATPHTRKSIALPLLLHAAI